MRLLKFALLPLWAATTVVAASSLDLMVAPQTLHSDRVTLIWNKPASASSAPDQEFEVLRDGEVIATTSKAHFTDTTLTAASHYRFQVRALATGDEATTSSVVSLTTKPREPIVDVTKHGAIGDGTTLNTTALQAAIDACPPGGIVHVPAGTFLSGALYLKSNMTLDLAQGAVLKGSADPQDYLPFNRNRFEGWELETHASLINAGTLDRDGPANIRNVSIRGAGTIAGAGRPLYHAIVDSYENRRDGLRARGRLVLFMNAANIEVSGITLEESSCWTLHYIYSENVSLHGLTIRSDVHNGDGIDPDSSVNSYIFNSTFDTGDDCIAIKSGKNPEGNVVNRPTENVRIFDCTFSRGHGISIGSEMSGGVRNVLVEDCIAGPLLHGLQIKGTKDRGGFVENVTVRNCDLQQITVNTVLNYNNDGAAAPTVPLFRNFRFENIDLSSAPTNKPVIHLNGFEADGHRTQNVTFDGITLPADASIKLDRVENVTFTDLQTVDDSAPRFEITRSVNVTVD
ncbi:glycoside hydrolase family 28 protein [Actomonas aquatica]|uniref:Glycoside hydrolase family 28 protein n=1 Tax=Actomonas aquatica TaxID=2866162 RepID=A0ABZ1C8T6_9BACT|nr:glycoside hydrolase family 28 protein [Opitutus sp. WL0086]WRQ86730.1 glycoside hydrolase family 28 protein [Opitutus sp. WL0086]